MPTTPDIIVEEGHDPHILGLPGIVPEGFAGVPPSKVQDLLSLVGHETKRLVGEAPSELVEMIIEDGTIRIPVYALQETMPLSAATHMTDANKMQMTFQPPNTFVGHGYEFPRFRGISMKSAENVPTNIQRLHIGHEILHTLTRFGIHGEMKPPMEAFVARLEKEYYSPRDGLTADKNWDPETFGASTGLCQPDYGRMNYLDNYTKDVLYLETYFALDKLRAEQVWAVWLSLTQIAKQRTKMPVLADIQAAVRDHAGPEAENILRGPSFKPIQPGLQHFQFGTAERDVLRVYALHAEPQPNYGAVNMGTGVRQDLAFTIQATNSQAECRLLNRVGNPIQQLEMGRPIPGRHEFVFAEMLDAIQRNPPAWKQVRKILGKKMEVRTAGMPAAIIRKG